ncbi:MAG: biotin attachment protein [Deltaproteobacteria bacterium]|nr:MAG: biotin attachment protein [Deltaproteobacteria bacterium]
MKGIFAGLDAKGVIKKLRESEKIFLTSTGPRDTGQSDYKNRITLHDLRKLAPIYNRTGYFSVELHGGARFHQDLMNNKISPFDEVREWVRLMPDVFTQTLIRATNVWGYRMYPRNVVKLAVSAFVPYIDVWRCFDFLNYVPNMAPIAEIVLAEGKIFEPAISFTESDDCTDEYYLKVVEEIVSLCGGTDSIILCIKDMAGVGSPARVERLIASILDRYPDMVIQYHRHSTDGLAIPAIAAAARAGAKLFDCTDDAFSRFYGHPPVRPLVAYLRELGFQVEFDFSAGDEASDVIRDFMRAYNAFESPFKGFSYDVKRHRMPGGAFPSSFEQAEKGGFLDLMPAILKGMSYGNRIIKYFDVTPGSQITWTTWAGLIQRFYKEEGEQGIEKLFETLERYFESGEDFDSLSEEDRERLLRIYSHATDDLKNLLLGKYGPLPFGWPKDWVYRSVFGENWEEIVREQRIEASPLDLLPEEDLKAAREALERQLERPPTDEEFVLYLMHPKATVDYIKFRETYGRTDLLPTQVWFYGLRYPGDTVRFSLDGKPHVVELMSIGEGVKGVKNVVLSVDNVMHVFEVEMPDAVPRKVIRRASPSVPGEVGSPVKGTVWRIGSKERQLHVGDFVKKGEEILNIEVMKTENAVMAPISGKIKEICVSLNENVEEGQLLMVIVEEDE